MIGVDEAGKGAVVGSMFVAAVDLSVGIEAPDSKRLSAEGRESLAERIRRDCAVSVVEVTADEIDGYVEGDDGGMNDLMVEAHSRALAGFGGSGDVVADASDTDADRFARRLRERVGDGYDVDAEHGADDRYDAVGAASVVAKVERDRHVDELRYDAGSGYPGDPSTVGFLRERAPDYPDCVRRSWATAERVVREEGQSDLGDF